MVKSYIKIDCVQLIQKRPDGLTVIGVPVKRAFGLEVRKKMFLNHSDIIPYPAACLDKITLKKALMVV